MLSYCLTVSFSWEDKKVLTMDGCTATGMFLMPQTCTLKNA